MFNKKLFEKQSKEFKQNKEMTDVKYDVLNTIELYNKENIYNINMIVDSEQEAEEFVRRVEVPDEEWKTITDVIIDVRREKLEKLGQVDGEYIQQLLLSEDYIGLYEELEKIFLHKIMFSMTKKFIDKVTKFGIEQVVSMVDQNRSRGYSTTLCMIQ